MTNTKPEPKLRQTNQSYYFFGSAYECPITFKQGFMNNPYPTDNLKKMMMMMVIFETNFVHYGRTHRGAHLLNGNF